MRKPAALSTLEQLLYLVGSLTQAMTAQVEAQQELARAVKSLAEPRRSVPVRNGRGDILYVIDGQEN